MNATIRIRNLQVYGIVGILPHERLAPQPLVINAELECDNIRAGVTDHLSDTVDYAAVCDRFRAVIAASSDGLLERLTARLLAEAMHDPRVHRATVSVAKPHAIADAERIEVQLTADR